MTCLFTVSDQLLLVTVGMCIVWILPSQYENVICSGERNMDSNI